MADLLKMQGRLTDAVFLNELDRNLGEVVVFSYELDGLAGFIGYRIMES
jgi:hypothetical protein